MKTTECLPSEQRFYDELLSIGSSQARMLLAIPELERAEVWERDGAFDMVQWVSARAQISNWTARRWIRAGWALEEMPYLAGALARGWVSLDKVLELCRFATVDTAEELVTWAATVSTKDVRQRADLVSRTELEVTKTAIRQRRFGWFLNQDSDSYKFYGQLPTDDGAKVIKAIDRLALKVAPCPEDDNELDIDETQEARRADALVALATAQIAKDQDPDRATVVLHADLQALRDGSSGVELEGGCAVHPETALRLACDCRSQVIAYEGDAKSGRLAGLGFEHGRLVGATELMRSVPRWLRRKLVQRDGRCTFPGCEFEAFTQAHHIQHWIKDGPMKLENLILVCSFHHRLVHEFGWGVDLDPTTDRLDDRPSDEAGVCQDLAGRRRSSPRHNRHDNVRWFRPDGERYYGGLVPFKHVPYEPPPPAEVIPLRR